MKSANQLFKVYAPTILLYVFSVTLSCQQMSVRTNPETGEIDEVSGISIIRNPGSKATSETKMKAMIEQAVKIWNQGELALVDKLYAPEYVGYHTDIGDKLVGLNRLKQHVASMRVAYPDLTVKIDELLIKDDMSVTRWTFTGTNEGAIGEMPATGKRVQVSGVTIGRFFSGKITKEWAYWNNATVLDQLGYIFVPPAQNITK